MKEQKEIHIGSLIKEKMKADRITSPIRKQGVRAS